MVSVDVKSIIKEEKVNAELSPAEVLAGTGYLSYYVGRWRRRDYVPKATLSSPQRFGIQVGSSDESYFIASTGGRENPRVLVSVQFYPGYVRRWPCFSTASSDR